MNPASLAVGIASASLLLNLATLLFVIFRCEPRRRKLHPSWPERDRSSGY